MVFISFVVRKVRVTAARKLNRGRNRTRSGRGRGEKALLNLLLLTTKEKSTPKNPPATQANTQQRANTIHFKLCFFSRNTCLCFHVQSSALVASFLSLPGKQPGEATSLRSKRFQWSYCAKVRAKTTESLS